MTNLCKINKKINIQEIKTSFNKLDQQKILNYTN